MEILFDWDWHRVEAGSLFIIFYVLFIYVFILFYILFFIYFHYFFIFIHLFFLIFFYFILFYYYYYFFASIWSKFLLRDVSIYIVVFVNLFIYLLIYLGAPWGSSFLVQLHVDGMQLYQQWNTLRLYRAAFCGGVYFQ